MTREEALLKLDEAIRNKLLHKSARDEYESLCNTPKGREDFLKILNIAQQQNCKKKTQEGKKL